MRAAACALGIALAAACAAPLADPAPPRALLLHARRIYLGHPGWESVEGLLVEEGRVVRAGSLAELSSQVPERAIDLRGYAVPGLQDAHGHIEGLGKALETVDLRAVASYAELVERVAAQAERQAAGTWVEGRGWDQNLWPGQEFPDHRALSERVSAHPVFLRRVDGHAALCNQAALEACGLAGEDAGRLAPIPGCEVLLAADGKPTGVLIDAAMDLVSARIPAPDEATRERRLLSAQSALLAAGLTCVHDRGVDRWTVRTLERLRDEARWKLRVVLYLSMGTDTSPADLSGFPRAADESGVVAVPGVKLYIDGALGSRGAALLEDYADRPGHRGLLQMQPEELEVCVQTCARLGLQPATHAIGDRGNRLVLDAYEAAMRLEPGLAALRPRIEHAQVVAPEDWARFDALGVVASMQPTHCTSDMPWVPARLGLERSRGTYAWKRLAADPAALAFGSDFPVEDFDPREGLYAARTRQDPLGEPPGGFFPDQCLDARAALAGFTFGAARACRQEDRRGRLAHGCFADLTVLDVDPLECSPDELLRARVLFTVVNGRVVHAAQDP